MLMKTLLKNLIKKLIQNIALLKKDLIKKKIN